ncbi:purine nucleoside phosphorylase-like [Glandiceps talaboti]
MAEVEGYTYDECEATSQYLLEKTKQKPTIGIICGSGLGGIVDKLEDTYKIAYEDIPNFPVSTVPGHASRLVFGKLNGKTVVCMQGRTHMYEGVSLWKITIPVRVMSLLGVHTLLVTNAAGGINPKYNVGDFMVIKDHINMPGLAGNNPLVGPNDDRFGPRFPSMTGAYDKDLRALVFKIAKELEMENLMQEGIYSMVGGPSFESIAELRYLQTIGADSVGMSTCPEVVVARHSGMKVLGMSLVTNKCILDYEDTAQPNHEEVLETGRLRAADMQNLVSAFVKRLPEPTVNNNKIV